MKPEESQEECSARRAGSRRSSSIWTVFLYVISKFGRGPRRDSFPHASSLIEYRRRFFALPQLFQRLTCESCKISVRSWRQPRAPLAQGSYFFLQQRIYMPNNSTSLAWSKPTT